MIYYPSHEVFTYQKFLHTSQTLRTNVIELTPFYFTYATQATKLIKLYWSHLFNILIVPQFKVNLFPDNRISLHKKFSIKDFFSKCDQIRSKLRIWLHLLKKSLLGNLIFVECIAHFQYLICPAPQANPKALQVEQNWDKWSNWNYIFFL